jgi:hypothetical protein
MNNNNIDSSNIKFKRIAVAAITSTILLILFVYNNNQKPIPFDVGLYENTHPGPPGPRGPPGPPGQPGKAGSASATASATSTVIIKNEPASIKSYSGTITTTSPPGSPSSAFADVETIRLDRTTLTSNALLSFADVAPFHIIGGHVSLNSPSSNLKLVAATITNKGVEHAVIIDLIKTLETISTKDALYHVDLGETISGTNPFTKKHDTVSSLTDILLWNNGRSPIVFGSHSAATVTLIFKK